MNMPRPFYLVGHNTNSIKEIEDGLAAGLNAFEIDIHRDRNSRLFVSHNLVHPQSSRSAFPPPPRLVPFLQALHALATSAKGQRIALIIFDCKINSAEHGARVVAATRKELNKAGLKLPVIYSVPTLGDARTFFQKVAGDLQEHEGLMIDQESNPSDVATFFRNLAVDRAGYGNGATALFGVGLPTPNLAAQMDAGVALRALGQLRFVYPWVLVARDTMREFIRIGVNGVMVDTSNADRLVEVLTSDFADRVRVATRADDPFQPDSSSVLQVVTKDVPHAETDALVELELELENGTQLKRVVDGGYRGRFERGTSTFVTFWDSAFRPGDVRAISVRQDGGGRDPNWFLDNVTLRDEISEQEKIDPKVVEFDTLVEKGVTVRKPC